MAITVPNTASVLSGSGQVASSFNRWVNLGFVTTPGASGSMMWFSGSSEASGSPMLPIVLAINGTYQSELFSSPCGLFAGCITGGCAIFWTKAASA